MLTKLRIKINCKEDLNHNACSLFHGAMMEAISSDYAEFLHRSALKPYSQTLKKDGSGLFWEINTLNEEAREQIILPLLDDALSGIYLKHKTLPVSFAQKEIVRQTTYDELVKKWYIGEAVRKLPKICLTTPTAFKQEGTYVFMPDVELIFQSLMNKYDSATTLYSVYSREALEDIVNRSRISDYKIKSANFHLEAVKLKGFMGDLCFRSSGSMMMASLIGLLLDFGQYSGIGIKTALGMGACDVISE